MASRDDEDPLNRRTESLNQSPIQLGGRGKTLFVWTGDMKLDVLNNDMTLYEGAQVIHEDAATGDVVQLDAERFVADLQSTGGLAALRQGQTRPDQRPLPVLQ